MTRCPEVGMAIPSREYRPDNVQLMLYNAAIWNGHRIHFDLPYATEVEGYPGLVLAGPMLGDWLHQVVEEWLGDDGAITNISYSNRGATYVGDTLLAGGTITAFDPETGTLTLDVYIKNDAGDVVAPGVITARWQPTTEATP
jgi:3-methylfumaryl-CoA hydratase